MIAVAVIGILAAIAIPSYQGYVERANRSDAHAGLMEAAGQMERCYTVNNTYEGCISARPSPDEKYTITPTTATASEYLLTASWRVGARNDNCPQNLTLDQSGDRQPPECW
nr:type IV pilin protein [Halomonas sp. 25-S5]